MKIFSIVLCILGLNTVFGQDCQQFLFFQKGKTIEMTIYDKTGGVSGKQIYQVLDVTNEGSILTSNLSSEIFDKTGKSIAKSNSLVKCNAGVMMVDMKFSMPQFSHSAGTADATVGNEFLEFPFNVQVGNQLKDGSFTMTMTNQKMTVEVSITDRNVVGQESVTTSAGTWSCFKINSKNTVTMNMAGRSMPPSITESTSWYKPGFGIIKSTSANGSTAITSIK
jgi:hypothetical protein